MAPDNASLENPARQVDAVMQASRVLVGILARSVAEVEDVVAWPQLRVLVVIASRGPMNLGEVAQTLGVHSSNATRTIDKLVTTGFVERTDDPADRRFLVLTLTPRGHDLVEQVMGYRRSSIAAVMKRMPSSRRRTLAAALEAFADAAGERPGDEQAFLLGLPS